MTPLHYNKDFVKSLVTFTRLIQIIIEFQFHYLVLMWINIYTFHCAFIITSVLSDRFYNNNWLKVHHTHCFQIKHEDINSIITVDSVVAGLTWYTKIWKNIFGNRFINLGISEDRVESVLWRARDITFLPPLQNVVILYGKNNINKDPSYDIVPNIIISCETDHDYSKLRNIAKLSNAAIVGISESKLDDSILSSEIRINNYNTLV